MAVTKPAEHPSFPEPRIGVLLLNLGTPDGTDYWPVRRYLSEFLSDKRVIETNPLIWQPILPSLAYCTNMKRSYLFA